MSGRLAILSFPALLLVVRGFRCLVTQHFAVKTLFSILIGAGLLAAAIAAVGLMAKFRPEAKIVERPKLLTTVEVVPAKSGRVAVQLPSQGVIEPARAATIAAEVAGRVVEVSARFETGERFAEGELLLRLEDADYQAALIQAEASLAEARAVLVTEKARAEQAVRDWTKLGSKEKPTDLVLRKPQLASAEAQVSAVTGSIEKARRDLERTRITAPFAGRLSAKRTELGSYLAPGSPIADFTSTGRHRVRLPLNVEDLAFLPHNGDHADVPVMLEAEAAGQRHRWQGKILRTEGEVERASRSVYLVAEVAEKDAHDLLQPGLFVRARISGVTLENLFRIPRAAFLDHERIIIIDEQNRLRFQKVEIVRADGTDLLVSSGLTNGDRICLTTLAAPVEGMEVRVINTASQPATAGTSTL